MTTVVMLMMLNGSIGLYLRTARESPGGKKKMLLHQKVRRYLNYIYIYTGKIRSRVGLPVRYVPP